MRPSHRWTMTARARVRESSDSLARPPRSDAEKELVLRAPSKSSPGAPSEETIRLYVGDPGNQGGRPPLRKVWHLRIVQLAMCRAGGSRIRRNTPLISGPCSPERVNRGATIEGRIKAVGSGERWQKNPGAIHCILTTRKSHTIVGCRFHQRRHRMDALSNPVAAYPVRRHSYRLQSATTDSTTSSATTLKQDRALARRFSERG